MPSIFTKIVQGEIPCHKIAETENYLAFLDVMPLVPGHTLVIPKREVDFIFDLTDAELEGLMVFAKTISFAIKKAIPCKRIGISVIGLEVPHAHVHLIPISQMDDMNFSRPKLTIAQEELEAIASQIKSFL